MEKALVAFSFDDGRLDNYTNAYPILKKYGLPATFNITTGFIKGNIDRDKFDFPEPMTIEMVQEIFENENYEIAGHGNQHINTIEDITSGINELCDILKTESLWGNANGFASPGSDLTKSMYERMKKVLDACHINYVRVSFRYNSFAFLKVLLRKISRIVKWPWLYRIAYQDTLMSEMNEGILYSVPILSSVTLKQLRSLIQQAIIERKACVLMFHSIVNSDSMRNTWDFPCDRFEHLCKMLSLFRSEGLLDIKTTMDISYILKQ